MATAGSDIELLTEHFGYPPVSLLDDIINSVNIYAGHAIDAVENGLLAEPPSRFGFGTAPPPTSKTTTAQRSASDPQLAPEEAYHLEVENGTHQLETLLLTAIDVNFDKFELYTLRNILAVPAEDRPFIRLAHYNGLDFSSASTHADTEPSQADAQNAASTPDRPSVESVTALRRRLQASQRLNVMLAAEKARNEALLGQLRGLVGRDASTGIKVEDSIDGSSAATSASGAPLAFLLEKGALRDADTERPLATTTAFSLSQMEALRSLSKDLRKVLPGLGKGSTGADGEDDVKGWRRERLEYIEGATRRHLEHNRGLELGKDGEVRDGEWQGEGRKLAAGEVEGLEKVVAVLGGGAGREASSARADEMDTS